MKFVFAIAALAIAASCLPIAIAVIEGFSCDPQYCSRGPCVPVTKCAAGEQFVPKGSTCGCCNACRKIVEEGEGCSPLLVSGGPARILTCAAGLSCSHKSRTCVRNSG